MERAGGTTFHKWLQRVFPTYVALQPWHFWTNEPANSISAQELGLLVRAVPGVAGVGGHLVRSYLDYEGAVGRRVLYLTFLRDPVKRYLSHFNYQRNRVGVPWTLEQFLDEPRMCDLQTTRLAGRRDLDAAKRALDHTLGLVGLTDRYDETLLLFRAAMGLPKLDLRYQRRNATRPDEEVVRFDELEPVLQERVLEANALDAELLRHAREVVFPAQLQRYPGDMSADLAQLRASLEGFEVSRRAEARRKATYGLLTLLVEPAVHRVAALRGYRVSPLAGQD